MTEKKRDKALISRLHRAIRTEDGRKWQLIRKKKTKRKMAVLKRRAR
jgi:hypothetical protein